MISIPYLAKTIKDIYHLHICEMFALAKALENTLNSLSECPTTIISCSNTFSNWNLMFIVSRTVYKTSPRSSWESYALLANYLHCTLRPWFFLFILSKISHWWCSPCANFLNITYCSSSVSNNSPSCQCLQFLLKVISTCRGAATVA